MHGNARVATGVCKKARYRPVALRLTTDGRVRGRRARADGIDRGLPGSTKMNAAWLIALVAVALLLYVGKAVLLAKRYRAHDRSSARVNPYAYDSDQSDVLGRIKLSELMAR